MDYSNNSIPKHGIIKRHATWRNIFSFGVHYCPYLLTCKITPQKSRLSLQNKILFADLIQYRKWRNSSYLRSKTNQV